MIKFAFRKNLIYILQLILWNLLRKIEKTIISKGLGFEISSIFTILMFLGNFIFGLIFYLYQLQFLKKNKNEPSKFMSITLLQKENELVPPDSKTKIYFLLFFASFFDFIEFTLSMYTLQKFVGASPSLQSRLSGILTISSALFFYYVLKFQIFKHQFLSLLIIGGCLVIIIVTEFFFQHFNLLSNGEFVLSLAFVFFLHFFNSLLDNIEKYLFEYDYINPFQALMWEGIFGSSITLIYYFVEDNPLNDLRHFKNLKEQEGFAWHFTVLIFLLLLYIILCGGRNTFRVVTNKIYSPMAKTLTDYILNPFYLIYDFVMKDDFAYEKERNYFYFFLNFILAFIISICGSIYNEFLVIFCCDLDHETHYQLSRRATIYVEGSSDNSEKNSSENEESSSSSENAPYE